MAIYCKDRSGRGCRAGGELSPVTVIVTTVGRDSTEQRPCCSIRQRLRHPESDLRWIAQRHRRGFHSDNEYRYPLRLRCRIRSRCRRRRRRRFVATEREQHGQQQQLLSHRIVPVARAVCAVPWSPHSVPEFTAPAANDEPLGQAQTLVVNDYGRSTPFSGTLGSIVAIVVGPVVAIVVGPVVAIVVGLFRAVQVSCDFSSS